MNKRINFGEIWIADLSSRIGTELCKKRPVLVVQDQALLDVCHPSTLIVPLTTNLIDNAEPLRIRIKANNKLQKDSDLLIDQIRAIDNQRLIGNALIQCDETIMQKVRSSILEIIGTTKIMKIANW